MRIEKFENLAVAINDEIAIWFRLYGTPHLKNGGRVEYTDIKWTFIGANEDGRQWYVTDKEDFEAVHPGMLDDILRRLNDD